MTNISDISDILIMIGAGIVIINCAASIWNDYSDYRTRRRFKVDDILIDEYNKLRNIFIKLSVDLFWLDFNSDIDRDNYRLIIPSHISYKMLGCKDIVGKNLFVVDRSRFNRINGFRFEIVNNGTDLVRLVKLDDSSTTLEWDFSNLIAKEEYNKDINQK